jgi:hypothetical protein
MSRYLLEGHNYKEKSCLLGNTTRYCHLHKRKILLTSQVQEVKHMYISVESDDEHFFLSSNFRFQNNYCQVQFSSHSQLKCQAAFANRTSSLPWLSRSAGDASWSIPTIFPFSDHRVRQSRTPLQSANAMSVRRYGQAFYLP